MEVQLKESDRINLIGFFLRDLLRTNLQNESCKQSARRMKGAILFNASGMQATVVFKDESVQIQPGGVENVHAKISGEMSVLLDVALGANYLKFLLTGKIRIGGNILILLKLLKILRRPN